MKIIIVGGGTLAYHLIRILHKYRHHIVLIEQQKSVCERIATDFDVVQVYQGDGTSMRMLEEIDAHGADFYIAVTGKDENNLIGCEIAKRCFDAKLTVARVNNPKNAEMFYRLGVDKVYSGTQILADIIEQEIDFIGMRTVFKIEKTSKRIVEFRLSPRSSACGRTLEQHDFPGTSKVVLITREDGRVEMPRGSTFMHAGDIMLMVCDENEFETVWRSMVR